jgi:type I restriction enzyme M protein
VQLIDRYFAAGMERLIENKTRVEPVSAQLLAVLDDAAGKQAVAELVKQWAGLDKLQTRYEQYREKCGADFRPVNGKANRQDACSTMNKAQHQLREAFDPFFGALHEGLKQLDKTVRQHEKQEAEKVQTNSKRTATDRKTRALKTALEELHKEVKNAEIFYQHIHWLQERFPKAEYEDVTGLCKLASPAEVEEQEYSLNPGRYVGVVIEEDGKTEEEFIEEILSLSLEIRQLAKQTSKLEGVIFQNIEQIAGEA